MTTEPAIQATSAARKATAGCPPPGCRASTGATSARPTSRAPRPARIEGLENGQEYQFLVVAYDFPGNPLSSGEIIKATPIQTNGLWEQCETEGNICGEAGFCSVVEPGPGLGWLAGGLGLFGLAGWGVRLRRRRNA